MKKMNLSKRILPMLALVCLTLLSAVLPAYADVLIEPQDDFYETHKNECVYNHNRTYVVNTSEGHAYLYVSPESERTISGYSNGDRVAISWLYTDANGNVWGSYSYETGWFCMSDLTVVYDSYSFLEQYGSQMEPYVKGSYTIETDGSRKVTLWNYPGKPSDAFFESDVDIFVTKTYTDTSGKVWGYIPYYVGMREMWICLSSPYETGSLSNAETEAGTKSESSAADTDNESRTPPVNDTDIPLKAEPTPKDQIPMSDGNKKTLGTIGALIGGVLLGTAVTIGVLFIRKKSGHHV